MESERFFCALACIAMGYFIGNFSPSYLVGLLLGYDVRDEGSHNAGASNTLILAGKTAGLLVAVTDIFKAWAAWRMAQWLFPKLVLAGVISGSACVIGHMYPVFLRFRGGKGFACLGGMVLAHGTGSFICLFSVAIVLVLLLKYVSVVASTMAFLFPLWYLVTGGMVLGAMILLIPAATMLCKHMENFRRIRTGQELRISFLWDKSGELERIGQSEN